MAIVLLHIDCSVIEVLNTLAAELLLRNSTDLHYATFSITLQYAKYVYLIASPVCWCIY